MDRTIFWRGFVGEIDEENIISVDNQEKLSK